jgi:hypothetical protein
VKTYYITEDGDDKNEGESEAAAVYSWRRALKLPGQGGCQFNISEAARKRILAELENLEGSAG